MTKTTSTILLVVALLFGGSVQADTSSGSFPPPSQCLRKFPNARRVGGEVTAPVALQRSDVSGKHLTAAGFRCGDFVPILETVVDKGGRVVCVHLVRPRGKPVPNQIAAAFERSLAGWRFKPATMKGSPVEVIMYFTIYLRCA